MSTPKIAINNVRQGKMHFYPLAYNPFINYLHKFRFKCSRYEKICIMHIVK
jgi:hypothetical protein